MRERFLVSQIFIDLSKEQEAILFPSGEKQTFQTQFLWSKIVLIREPLSAFQILNVLSLDPETIILLSGEKHTD